MERAVASEAAAQAAAAAINGAGATVDSLQAALTGVDTMLAETLAGSVGDSRSPKAAAAAPAAPARAPVKVGLPF
jgi:hypothetical protein